MEGTLKSLLLKQGLTAEHVLSFERHSDAPLSVVDLAAGADSEGAARTWATELGLTGRVLVGKFVLAWLDARLEHFPGEVPSDRLSCDTAKRELSRGSTRTTTTSNVSSGSSSPSCGGQADGEEEEAITQVSARAVGRLISSCPLFAGLDLQALKAVEGETTVQKPMLVGGRVFELGQSADEMYFVVSGAVAIIARDGTRLMEVEAGGYFGEIGVLFAGVRSAGAVVSVGPCQLAILRRSSLERIMHKYRFGAQLHENGQSLPHVRSWFASRLPLFARCAEEPAFLDDVAKALDVRVAEPGQVILHEGADGDEMFFIFEGAVTIVTKQLQGSSVRITAPSYFGELALLFPEPRSATVRCESTCRFYVLGRAALHSIMQKFPKIIANVYTTAQEATSLKVHFIKKMLFFKAIHTNEEFLANIQLAFESHSVAPGEFILRQGDVSDGRMFAIAHGHAEIRKIKNAGEAPQRVATISAGSIFGEVALLLDTPRVASVVAIGHCHLYTLSRDAFETLAVVYPAWWRDLTSERGALLKQLQTTGVEIASTTTSQTHGLQLPQVAGATVSSMLSAVQAPLTVSAVPESKLCVVCRCNEKCILSMPCGHVASCEECHGSLRSCPVCRAHIEKGVKAFF